MAVASGQGARLGLGPPPPSVAAAFGPSFRLCLGRRLRLRLPPPARAPPLARGAAALFCSC
ncbi:hypothetical protein E2562_024059 [Oryza meyeriana var. granulata]|uniref:Uncharacterized protein n=1 Tax=Oryza meyeriana var. granulata TaxID=110450 RepID=A0A6G1CRI0_9ORYZ|nr:hypothetical protein E2562_024059 [Oryza meyeriana var. granulata]